MCNTPTSTQSSNSPVIVMRSRSVGWGTLWGIAFVSVFALAQRPASAALPPLVGVQQMSVGGYHVCALINGGVQCWGENSDGQIGNGSYFDATAPTPVHGLQSGVTAVVSGADHSCALIGGAVQCWGNNMSGELGDGTLTTATTPVNVVGLGAPVIALTAGVAHTCALIQGGTVQCWGYNSNGQLGNGRTVSTGVSPPVTVDGIVGTPTAVVAGGYHTCVIVNGGLQCWGDNADGELNDGGVTDSYTATPALLNSGVVTLAGGFYHMCALMSTGGLRCWGWNGSGQLGNNSVVSTSNGAAVAVSGISSGVTSIAAGAQYTCAVVAGAAKCWGANILGALGDTTLTDRHVPAAVSGLASGVTAISAGADTTCAQVLVGGASELRCWGDNIDGEIGLGDVIYQYVPVAVSGISSGATAVATGDVATHACAVVAGAARCWGNNAAGQLGNNSTLDSATPVLVSGLGSGVSMIADGYQHTCALAAGAVKCWGDNTYGQLGNGSTVTSLVPVTAIASGAIAVSAGGGHSCAVLSGGTVKCWGNNAYNQLGDGTTATHISPTGTAALGGQATAIAAGTYHTCALLQTGAIACWGQNASGQIGNNDAAASTPQAVANITSGATAIAAGDTHTCAIVSGAAKCWGDGEALGNGINADSGVPVAVSTLGSSVNAITAGTGFSCAAASGAVSCWGALFTFAPVPVAVPGLGANVSALGTGLSHVCALVSGAVECQGTDYFGELGNGRSIYLEAPATVVLADDIFGNGFEGN